MGEGRLVTLLSLVLALSRPTDWRRGKGGGLSTALRPGLKCGGLESKFGWGPRPLDRSGMGCSYLCLGYKRGVCFRGTQLGYIDSRIAVSM
jgi:hypothetical protein